LAAWTITGGVDAQPTIEQSRGQAVQALELLLEEGDREGAIRSALRGLPASLTLADIDLYPEAMSALSRAFGNRSVRVDWQDETFGLLSPDGTRAVLARSVSAPMTPDVLPSVVILEPATGRVIGAPIVSTVPMDGGMIGHAGLAMAPRAGLVAVDFGTEGLIHIHRLEDGARVTSLNGRAWQMRFSPDGRYLATSHPDGLSNQPWPLEVREVATGAVVLRASVPPTHSFDWASENAILLGLIEAGAAGQPSLSVLRLDLQGNQTPVLAEAQTAPGMIVVSPDRSHFMTVSGPDVTVFDMQGRQIMVAPSPEGGASFARGGSAVAVVGFSAGGRISNLSVDVYALDGTPLEPEPSDFMMFDAFVYGDTGEPIGNLGMFSMAAGVYEGDGVPEGMDLVRAARDLVGVPDDTDLPEVDPIQQRSEAFAEEAEGHLRTGDRISAMVAALKGLPDDPDDADFARFEAAHLMLFRSVAARVLRLPIEQHTPAMLDPTGTRLVHGGQAPALYDMPGGALIAPLRRADGSVYVSATIFPHFDPTGALVAVAENRRPVLHIYDARTGAAVVSLEFPITDLADYTGYSTILVPSGFSHDGGAFAVHTRHHIFIVDTTDWSVRQLDPPSRFVGFVSWLPARQLLLADPVYTEGQGPVVELFIHNGTTATPIRTIMSDADALRSAPLYTAPNRQGNALMAEEGDSLDGRVVVYDGAGQVRALAIGHEGNVQFVRGGTAIAYRDPRGILTESLRVISLTGETLTAEFQDHVVFDQAIFNERGDPAIWGVMPPSAPRYRGADLPTGRALWELAMEAVGDARWPEITAERIGAP
jgi:hypothetical protein